MRCQKTRTEVEIAAQKVDNVRHCESSEKLSGYWRKSAASAVWLLFESRTDKSKYGKVRREGSV